MRSSWTSVLRRRREDDGLVTSAVVVVVAVGVVALLFLAVLPLLRGTDQAGRTQTSADAAALAGAEAVREHALANLGSVIVLTGSVSFADLLGPSRGLGEATVYASRNDASVAQYRYDPLADEVYVKTASNDAPPRSGDHAPGVTRTESEATAELGVPLARCTFDVTRVITGYEPPPTPTPEPTPTDPAAPTPTPTPTPTPVPIYGNEFRFRCPGYDSGASESLADVLDDARDWLDDALEPSLVR